MPKKSYQKHRILALRELLLECTDEDNYITINKIISELSAEDLKADKRTIIEDIEMLNEIGMDIMRNSEKKEPSYAVVSRDFEMEEVKLLLDCVNVSKFLSQKKTEELMQKLHKLRSKHEAKKLQCHVYNNYIKSDNDGICRCIDIINTALEDEKSKPLSFRYFQYLSSNNKQYQNDGKPYFVYPLALTYTDNNYYLIAHDFIVTSLPKLEDIKYYRIDRMNGLRICEKSEFTNREIMRSGHLSRIKRTFDINNYINQNFSINIGGKLENITMQFPDHMEGIVIDCFGRDVRLTKRNNDYFEITEKIAVSPQFYGWIFGLGKEVKIIDPPHVAQGMKDMLKETYNIYTVPRKRRKDVDNS